MTTSSIPKFAPLVFLDTETCGLGLDDPIWEIALIRREIDGAETSHHFFVRHDPVAAANLPEAFLADHDTRYDPDHAYTPGDLSVLLAYLLRPSAAGVRAHVVGMCPWFDMQRISFQITGGFEPWHFHLIDAEAMAYAHLARRGFTQVPWSSDQLLRHLGLAPDKELRHTALYDAQLARYVFDHITQPDTLPVPVLAREEARR